MPLPYRLKTNYNVLYFWMDFSDISLRKNGSDCGSSVLSAGRHTTYICEVTHLVFNAILENHPTTENV